MQRLEVSGAVRPIYGSLGDKRLMLTNSTYNYITSIHTSESPVPGTARFKALVCDGSLDGIAGLNLAGGKDICLLLSIAIGVCYQVEVSATDR